MKKNILITGANGFIGSHLAVRLSQDETIAKIFCVDNSTNFRSEILKRYDKIELIEADLCDYMEVNKLPNQVNCVYALAALNGTSRFYEKPFTVMKNSTIPTINIIEKYAKISPIVYSSSSEVYASTIKNFNGKLPTSEDIMPSIEDIHNPRWSYATSKLLGEIAINAACVEFKAKATILRYHNVYGPKMGEDHFIPDFVQKARNGVFEIYGATETRAFLHIEDAVAGTIAASKAANIDAPIFHLGSNEEITISAAAKIILKMMGLDSNKIEERVGRQGSISRRIADTSKAARELGWQSKIDFAKGVRMYLESENKN